MDPSLGDCGARPQRDLRLDHPVHKTPEVQDDEDEESMMWLNDNGFVISKIMDNGHAGHVSPEEEDNKNASNDQRDPQED